MKFIDIDDATVFDNKISFTVDNIGTYAIAKQDDGKKYLYKDGDEYTSITGGWTLACQYNYNSQTSVGSASKESNCLQVNRNSEGGTFTSLGFGTINAIDFSGYSSIKVEFGNCNIGWQGAFHSGDLRYINGCNCSGGNRTNQTITINCSGQSSAKFYIIDNSNNYGSSGTLQIKKVWLE